MRIFLQMDMTGLGIAYGPGEKWLGSCDMYQWSFYNATHGNEQTYQSTVIWLRIMNRHRSNLW